MAKKAKKKKNQGSVCLYDGERSIFIRHLPPNLKPKFKAACYLRGKSMAKVITSFMRYYSRTGKMPT